jgi:hypothetical protein
MRKDAMQRRPKKWIFSIFFMVVHALGGNSQTWVNTVVRWSQTAKNKHSVEHFLPTALLGY